MSSPLVSIVTPSLNQAQFLPETLRCVREQTYPHIEHLIVDGVSTDGTLEILRQAPGIRWISEPCGHVEAINKGLNMASGEILTWLASDDTLDPDTVATAVAALQRTGADMVYGDVQIIDEHSRHLKTSRGIPLDYRVLLYGINYIGQQSAFFRRSLLDKAGLLREEFDNAFDYELWLRFAQHGRLVYVPGLRAQIRYHASAKSVAHNDVTQADVRRIRDEYWDVGGWPRLFQHSPWFALPHYGYRLKRQIAAHFCQSKHPAN